MFDLIITTTTDLHRNIYSIDIKERFPFQLIEEAKCFDTISSNTILIMDCAVTNMFPDIKIANIFYVGEIIYYEGDISTYKYLDDALEVAYKMNKKIIVIGSFQLYKEIIISLKHYTCINNVHIFQTKPDYDSYPYINFDDTKYALVDKNTYNNFIHYTFNSKKTTENNYLDLLENVNKNGWPVIGRNGKTLSLFGKTLEFDLRRGFPLLTTKKMFFRGIVEELLFFIRGNTDTKLLEEKNINIWNGNTNKDFLNSIGKNNRNEGVMGPMYGYQWRYFNSKYNEATTQPVDKKNSFDQLANVVEKLRKDRHSRRILLTDYNPLQADEGVLFPCHSIIIQFYVNEPYLDMFCYNRSSDFFHGIPFNIASSCLLLMIIAKLTRLNSRYINISMGDVHIYSEHIDAVEEQIKRRPYNFPNIIIPDVKTLEDVEKLTYEDFKLENYKYHPVIKKPMVA